MYAWSFVFCIVNCILKCQLYFVFCIANCIFCCQSYFVTLMYFCIVNYVLYCHSILFCQVYFVWSIVFYISVYTDGGPIWDGDGRPPFENSGNFPAKVSATPPLGLPSLRLEVLVKEDILLETEGRKQNFRVYAKTWQSKVCLHCLLPHWGKTSQLTAKFGKTCPRDNFRYLSSHAMVR